MSSLLKRCRCFRFLPSRLLLLLILVGVMFFSLSCSEKKKPLPLADRALFVSYERSIQPIFNRRCAVCHSCNDAPCQLDTTSFTGVDRGASSENVYADRMFSTDPSRIFIDAKSTKEWRERGFFPVIHHHKPGDPRNLDNSILYKLLEYRQHNVLPKMNFDAFGSRSCPNLEATLPRITSELAAMFRMESHSDLGMPYGFPRISEQEFQTIRDWLARGAPGPEKGQPVEDKNDESIFAWEAFFNSASPREQLVSRYLYEHLYYAHIYFRVHGSSLPNQRFYRLVRSRTAAPAEIDEIATRLPYEDPGVKKFSYRLRPVEATIVTKTHLPLEFSAAALERWKKLFLEPEWTLEEKNLPGYQNNVGANPFQVFEPIPALSRYRFLIENSEYIVASFMKGPVCRGQLALNVIDDHFFIFFLNPESDPMVVSRMFLDKVSKYLITPFRPQDLFSGSSESTGWSIWDVPVRAIRQLRQSFYPYFKSRQLKYLRASEEFQNKARPQGWSIEDIWDGDGSNLNAVLTVFRHHDSASVTKGAWGGMPKTSLILDYPIFERMYYDLVASFDIYSDLKVQLATRLYMDDLRIEAENLFLSFLPTEKRKAIRDFWYRGAEAEINSGDYPLPGTEDGSFRGTRIDFETQDPKSEFIRRLLLSRIPHHLGGLADTLNYSDPYGAVPKHFHVKSQDDVWLALEKIGGKGGEYVAQLPDIAFVRFKAKGAPVSEARVYTLLRNRAHYNVKFLFGEEGRMAESEDTLTVLSGFEGSYPNYFFDVSLDDAEDFFDDLVAIKRKGDSFQKFAKKYGVRRQEDRFWELSDFFNTRFFELDPVAAGIFDLNRYENY